VGEEAETEGEQWGTDEVGYPLFVLMRPVLGLVLLLVPVPVPQPQPVLVLYQVRPTHSCTLPNIEDEGLGGGRRREQMRCAACCA
jgi:hypothetical protein